MAFYSHQNKKKRGGSANFDSEGRGFRNGNSYGSVTLTKDTSGNNTCPKKDREKEEIRCQSQICNQKNHITFNCCNRFNHAYQGDVPQVLAALSLNECHENEWVLDTSTIIHMTRNPGTLFNHREYKGSDYIMVGNSQLLSLTYIGDAKNWTVIITPS